MSAAALVENLSRCGVRLWEEGDELRCRGSKKVLTSDVLDELRQRKQEVIQLLREDAEMHRTGIIQSERQVFELARQYFGLDERGGAA